MNWQDLISALQQQSTTSNVGRGASQFLNYSGPVGGGQNHFDLIPQSATPEQRASLMALMSNVDPTSGQYLDTAGQFGKYATDQTRAQNVLDYLKNPNAELKADAGHGGWLQHHGGDIINWATNPIDAATGNHISNLTGRLGGNLYNSTFGQVGGWLGNHVFGQNGMASGYTRHLMNMVAGAAMPGGEAITNGYRTDRANMSQRGLTPAQVNRAMVGNAATSATALVGGGLLSGLGSGGIAGTGLTTGSNLGNAAAQGALVGSGMGGVNTAVGGGSLEDILRSMGIGAVVGGAGGAAGNLGGAAGGRIGSGLASGATRGALAPALGGGNIEDILRGAATGGTTGGVTGLTGSGILGNVAGQGVGSLIPKSAASANAGGTNSMNTATSTAGTGTGAGGGFDLASLLQQLIAGGGLAYSANQDNQNAETARNIADPFGPQRGQYQSQLQQLMTGGPNAITLDPSYNFVRDQATQALDRRNAAQGRLNSGGAQSDLVQLASGLASQEFGNEEQRLAQLAGVQSSSPAAAAQAWALQRLAGQQQLGGIAGLSGPLLQSLIGGGGQLADWLKGILGGAKPGAGGTGTGTGGTSAGGFDPTAFGGLGGTDSSFGSYSPGGSSPNGLDWSQLLAGGGQNQVPSPGSQFTGGQIDVGGAYNPWNDPNYMIPFNDPSVSGGFGGGGDFGSGGASFDDTSLFGDLYSGGGGGL